MNKIFVPTHSPSEWQRLLAQPKLHWKKGRSAMTVAACWEAAAGTLPPEVTQVLHSSGDSVLQNLRLLAALPEWKVPLPGGDTESATDVMALTSNEYGLAVLAVEAKVSETFKPTLGEKQQSPSAGQAERTSYLLRELKLNQAVDSAIGYQLLHRTVSALLTARDFHAGVAIMMIHSFGVSEENSVDFVKFCMAMQATQLSPGIWKVPGFDSPRLYLSWCPGNLQFLDHDLPSME